MPEQWIRHVQSKWCQPTLFLVEKIQSCRGPDSRYSFYLRELLPIASQYPIKSRISVRRVRPDLCRQVPPSFPNRGKFEVSLVRYLASRPRSSEVILRPIERLFMENQCLTHASLLRRPASSLDDATAWAAPCLSDLRTWNANSAKRWSTKWSLSSTTLQRNSKWRPFSKTSVRRLAHGLLRCVNTYFPSRILGDSMLSSHLIYRR